MGKCVFGFDFGTLSCRGIALDLNDGHTLAVYEKPYEHGEISGKMYHKDISLGTEWYLQDPDDWIDCISEISRMLLKMGSIEPGDVLGLGTDFTSCTLLPVYKDTTPLCKDEKFRDRPNAWPKLWKHHGAQKYAEEIQKYASINTKWLGEYFGDSVSSEWVFPKLLQVVREDPDIYEAADYFMEAVDWITFWMTGNLTRVKGVLGVNSFWTPKYGYPDKAFCKAIDPMIENVVDEKLSGKLVTVGECVGHLSESSAKRLGLTTATVVSAGHCDSAVTGCGTGINSSGNLILVMGTSTCHQLIYKDYLPYKGACSIAADGMLPELYSYEAGQPATGDIFAWFAENCVPKSYYEQAETNGQSILQFLGEKAERLRPGESGLVALDWLNGNRSPLANYNLSGSIVGLTLDTKPEEIYRALVEANLFGSRVIVDQYLKNGLSIEHVWAVGGISVKSPWIIQLLADVLDREIKVPLVDNIPARGAAACGAVAAYNLYKEACKDFKETSERLIPKEYKLYIPNKDNAKEYSEIYAFYKKLYDFFGSDDYFMKGLKRIKEEKVSN